MNRSLKDLGLALMVVSQFTLAGGLQQRPPAILHPGGPARYRKTSV